MKRREFCIAFGSACSAALAGCVTDSNNSTNPDQNNTTEPPTDNGTQNEPIAQISTRDRYSVENGTIQYHEASSLYDVRNTIPGHNGGSTPQEIVILIHGVGMDTEGATEWFEESRLALNEVGYTDNPIVGFSYDARHGIDEIEETREIAVRNGEHLGEFIKQYKSSNSRTDVRLVGHSQGGLTLLSTIKYLYDDGWSGQVTSISLLAAAVDNDSVALSGPYGDPIQEVVGQADNFWDDNDTTMSIGYFVATGEKSLGSNPSEGNVPTNYEDHEVTYVPSHDEYLYPTETGCADEVVNEW